ncbi:MAG: hypothetical protein V2I41_14230, partial [Pseudomonadales bacterium]|nr:hypothetical protein [Pseudomonadales bacterium]
MALAVAYALIAIATGIAVYHALVAITPVAITRWKSDQDTINDQLQDIFYTANEARTFLLFKYVG